MPLQRVTKRLESVELGAAGSRLLTECLQRIEALQPRLEDPSIDPTSVFAEVDRWATVEPFSVQIRHLASSGLEHLAFLRRYIEATEGVPAMAGYTVVRTAIESAALGIWLINCGRLDKKLLYSLRLAWRNEEDVVGFAAVSGFDEQADLAAFHSRLAECRDHRGTLRGRRLDTFPRWSDILRESQKYVTSTHAITGLQAWKAASAFAHSNRSLTVQILEHQKDGRMTTRISTLAKFVEVAVDYVESLLEEVDAASLPRGRRR